MFIRVLCIVLALITPAMAQEPQVPQNKAQVDLSFAPVVKKVAPAVVNIYTKRTITRAYGNPFMNDPFLEQFFGRSFGGMRKQAESSLGSGVIIEPDGLIVTNAHVVKDAEEIQVVLADGRQFEAKLVLNDPPSDVALLRIDSKGEKLPFAPLRPSETMEVGDLVLAIGNPFGVGQTVTSGIVSALARSTLNINDFNFFIQTDAAINPGNSGGALAAMDGGVVGINSAIYSRDGGSLGIGFAIPSEMVATVVAAEKSGGNARVTRPWLGVTAQTVTSDIASSLGMTRPYGALVAKLHGASPLKEAGINVGDAILNINGHNVRDPQELKFRMATVPLGEQAAFTISRNGAQKTLNVKAIAPPDNPPRDETKLEGAHPLNGVTVANLNPAVTVELGLGVEDDDQGVVVTDISDNARANLILDKGDLIVEINNLKITTAKDLRKTLEKPSSAWSIVISNKGQIRQLLIR